MEIRNIENEVKKEYPKMEQISKKRLTKCIPEKWKKLGLSYVLINMMIKSKVLAMSVTEIKTIESGTTHVGLSPVHTPSYVVITTIEKTPIIGIGAMIFFIEGIIFRIIIRNSKFKVIKILTDILIFVSFIIFLIYIITGIIIGRF